MEWMASNSAARADSLSARTEALTGVPAEEIERFARAYAGQQPSVIRVMLGLEKHRNGPETARALACLPTLVGAWRHAGGGLMHLTAGLHLEALVRSSARERVRRAVIGLEHLGRLAP